ncbi:MAG: cyclodeaminase/cyclohydrolase family protein [Bacillota bacterium]|jgi:formiminotetrahydrofolate cyclodeaminase|nr:cyclodeaminase/cyclohydrolase family protein [Bacillota bacterium]NLL27127.1 cyclodeaminase/cyclohydrolase family protein [Erysipelotrichia bacterium]
MYKQTIEQFTIDLSSKAPVPGGGGVCALVGALASSLGSMVASLTIGKKRYQDVEKEIIELNNQSEALRIKLLEDINLDAESFLPLSKAYSLDKNNPERDAIMERCLVAACDGPLTILKDICQVIELLERYGQIGSKLAISDIATASMLAYGALYGCSINIKVNTKMMKNKKFAKKRNRQVDQLVDQYSQMAQRVFENINREMI